MDIFQLYQVTSNFLEHIPKLNYLTKVLQDVTIPQAYRHMATEYWTAKVTLGIECIRNNPLIISSSNIVKDAMSNISFVKQQQIYAAHIVDLSLTNLFSNILPIIQQCDEVIAKLQQLKMLTRELKCDVHEKDLIFVLKQADEFFMKLKTITQTPKDASIMFIVKQCQQCVLTNTLKEPKYSTLQLDSLITSGEKMIHLL